MKDGSINKFVIKTFLATIPLVALLLLYIIVDPFAVVRSHKPCPAFGSVYPFNKGYISTCAYIENREARTMLLSLEALAQFFSERQIGLNT